MKLRLDLVVCESLTRPGLLSLRVRLGNGALGSIHQELLEAGFRAGDQVALIAAEETTAKTPDLEVDIAVTDG